MEWRHIYVRSFFAVVFGIIIGAIIINNYKLIIAILLFVISVTLAVVLSIIMLPFRILYFLFDSITFYERNYTLKIVRLYDKVFITNGSKKARKRYLKKIEMLNKKIRKKEASILEKKAIKMLNEAKWVL